MMVACDAAEPVVKGARASCLATSVVSFGILALPPAPNQRPHSPNITVREEPLSDSACTIKAEYTF